MSVKDAAKRLEVSPSLVYALVEEGRLKCIRLGREGKRGRIIIKESDIEEFLESLSSETA